MKRKGTMLFFLILCMTAAAQPLFVGSYNMRYKNNHDSINGDYWG